MAKDPTPNTPTEAAWTATPTEHHGGLRANPLSDTLLRLPAVKAATGLSRSTIYDWTTKGQFPKAIPLGGNLVAWLASDIEAWIQARVAAARGEPGG